MNIWINVMIYPKEPIQWIILHNFWSTHLLSEGFMRVINLRNFVLLSSVGIKKDDCI